MARRRRVKTWLDNPIWGCVGLGAIGVGTAYVLREQIRTTSRNRLEGYVRQAAQLIAENLGVDGFDLTFRGCPTAHASQSSEHVCFSLEWAIDRLVADCPNLTCAWNRVVWVVAHEIGHILDQGLHKRRTAWSGEYEADRFAGWMLRRLGILPHDAINELARWGGSATHPPGPWRVQHVLEGYNSPLHQFVYRPG